VCAGDCLAVSAPTGGLTEFVRDHVGVSLDGLLRILQGILLGRQLAQLRRFLVPRFRHPLSPHPHRHHQDDEDQGHQGAYHHAYQWRQHDPGVLACNDESDDPHSLKFSKRGFLKCCSLLESYLRIPIISQGE